MGFINVFGRVATVVHGQTKLFELNCFKKKNFPLNEYGQTRKAKLSQSICPMPST